MAEISNDIKNYFLKLEKETLKLYDLAREAKKKSLDPEDEPEIFLARDLAERVEGILEHYGLKGIADRIRSLMNNYSREIVALKIAEDIVYGNFRSFEEEEAAEIAIRAALAILTEGITAAPLQGIDRVRIKQNYDGTKYLAIYYAGPIRSAGGTEQALTVLVADYIRQLLHLDKYIPTSEEIKRFIEEIRLYERKVGRFQYHISDSDLEKALRNIPIEITGVATNPIEVSIHRDLPRIETNKLRGGACRVLNDGVIGKAAKIKKIAEEAGLNGWDWLGEFVGETVEEGLIKPSEKYLADIIAGRPIFSHPSRSGGFRLRYGRSRNSGLAAIGLNPATMIILGGFLAVGTQVRIERPGKSGIVMPVTSIEGPIVKLRDGSVLRVNRIAEAEKIMDKIEEILFLGDILIGFGEFLENNHLLLPSGYVEEWWKLEVIKAINEKFKSINHAATNLNMAEERLREILDKWYENIPTADEAIRISLILGVPLHPYYTYYWSEISAGDVQLLFDWLKKCVRDLKENAIAGPYDEFVKKILENLGVPHKIMEGKVFISNDHAKILYTCLASEVKEEYYIENGLEAINMISPVKIRNKAPTYIGLRMGRPEKAKERTMKPPVHVLFPIGIEGGNVRNIIEAASKREIEVEISIRLCPKCGKKTFYMKCPECMERTIEMKFCPKCKNEVRGMICERCRQTVRSYVKQRIDLFEELKRACINMGIQVPPKLVKGVKGLTSALKIPEPLEKGILRAKCEVYVYKDGTIRFDITNAPLTHFKPREIGVSIEKLRELGYSMDCNGRPLTDDNQIVELKVQDIIIPIQAADYLVRVSKYIDELLIRYYKMTSFYNIKKREDLLGHLVIGIAPHTSAGIIGRIIGFTSAQVCFAHPYWHAAKRRNCDGDEDAIMLALDAFLNFSKMYLPEKRGGLMDAPLVVMITLDPREVDDEVFNLETCQSFHLEFYEKTLQYEDPKNLADVIEIVNDRLGKESQYSGLKFTHPTERIDLGPKLTIYKKLETMSEKVEMQMKLVEKIRAVDKKDVAERILIHHFFPDLIGNLRAFSTQSLRCIKCNMKYERPPLSGKCRRCGGKLVLTVHRKGIEKYLKTAFMLIRKYKLGEYYKQRIELFEKELQLLFESGDEGKQTKLIEFWRSEVNE